MHNVCVTLSAIIYVHARRVHGIILTVWYAITVLLAHIFFAGSATKLYAFVLYTRSAPNMHVPNARAHTRQWNGIVNQTPGPGRCTVVGDLAATCFACL